MRPLEVEYIFSDAVMTSITVYCIDNKGKVKGQEPRVNIVHAHPHCVGGLKSYNYSKAHKKPKTDSLLKTN